MVLTRFLDQPYGVLSDFWGIFVRLAYSSILSGNGAYSIPGAIHHVVLPHERERFAEGITQAEATEILRKDVGIAERAVVRLISAPLTDGQFDALVSFTFNLGAGALQRSTLRRKANRGEHEGVPAELMKWV